MSDDKLEVRLAVLEEQIRGIREQQKAHAEKTEKAIDRMATEMAQLLEIVNKGKGAYLGVTVFAAVVGGVAAKAFSVLGVAIR